MMPANYGNSYRITQSPGYVAISYEMVHETRIIPLDARPQVAPTIRQYMGEARGRWDGNTLVVETSRFKDDPVYRGSNPAALTLVERFTLSAPDRIEWSVTVDDPSSWARPWTFAMPLTRNDDEAIFEYACHEGNLAMPHLLSAARKAEAAGLTATDDGVGDSEAPSARPATRTARAAEVAGNGIAAGEWRIEEDFVRAFLHQPRDLVALDLVERAPLELGGPLERRPLLVLVGVVPLQIGIAPRRARRRPRLSENLTGRQR
jgi:hypothetical protein